MKVITALKQGLNQEQELLKRLSKDIYERWEKGIKVESQEPDEIAVKACACLDELSKVHPIVVVCAIGYYTACFC